MPRSKKKTQPNNTSSVVETSTVPTTSTTSSTIQQCPLEAAPVSAEKQLSIAAFQKDENAVKQLLAHVKPEDVLNTLQAVCMQTLQDLNMVNILAGHLGKVVKNMIGSPEKVDLVFLKEALHYCGRIKGGKKAFVEDKGAHLLILAVTHSNTKALELLIEYGINPAAPYCKGLNLVSRAVLQKNNSIIELLHLHGADINEVHNGSVSGISKGTTPLTLAIMKGFNLQVQCLIALGADLNLAVEGKTPLYYAILEQSTQCISLLLGNGGLVNKPCFKEMLPIPFAACMGYKELFPTLIQHSANPDINSHLQGALSTAARTYHTDHMEQLATAGADLDAWNPISPTHALTLLGAATTGAYKVAVALLKKGVDVNGGKVDSGITPLHLAAQHGKEDMVSLFIEKGAMIDFPTEAGLTPLMVAVRKGYHRIVYRLLEKGANPNHQDACRETPIHLALQGASPLLLFLLLSYGARASDHIGKFHYLRAPKSMGRYIAIRCAFEKIQATMQNSHSSTTHIPLYKKTLEEYDVYLEEVLGAAFLYNDIPLYRHLKGCAIKSGARRSENDPQKKLTEQMKERLAGRFCNPVSVYSQVQADYASSFYSQLCKDEAPSNEYANKCFQVDAATLDLYMKFGLSIIWGENRPRYLSLETYCSSSLPFLPFDFNSTERGIFLSYAENIAVWHLHFMYICTFVSAYTEQHCATLKKAALADPQWVLSFNLNPDGTIKEVVLSGDEVKKVLKDKQHLINSIPSRITVPYHQWEAYINAIYTPLEEPIRRQMFAAAGMCIKKQTDIDLPSIASHINVSKLLTAQAVEAERIKGAEALLFDTPEYKNFLAQQTAQLSLWRSEMLLGSNQWSKNASFNAEGVLTSLVVDGKKLKAFLSSMYTHVQHDIPETVTIPYPTWEAFVTLIFSGIEEKKILPPEMRVLFGLAMGKSKEEIGIHLNKNPSKLTMPETVKSSLKSLIMESPENQQAQAEKQRKEEQEKAQKQREEAHKAQAAEKQKREETLAALEIFFTDTVSVPYTGKRIRMIQRETTVIEESKEGILKKWLKESSKKISELPKQLTAFENSQSIINALLTRYGQQHSLTSETQEDVWPDLLKAFEDSKKAYHTLTNAISALEESLNEAYGKLKAKGLTKKEEVQANRDKKQEEERNRIEKEQEAERNKKSTQELGKLIKGAKEVARQPTSTSSTHEEPSSPTATVTTTSLVTPDSRPLYTKDQVTNHPKVIAVEEAWASLQTTYALITSSTKDTPYANTLEALYALRFRCANVMGTLAGLPLECVPNEHLHASFKRIRSRLWRPFAYLDKKHMTVEEAQTMAMHIMTNTETCLDTWHKVGGTFQTPGHWFSLPALPAWNSLCNAIPSELPPAPELAETGLSLIKDAQALQAAGIQGIEAWQMLRALIGKTVRLLGRHMPSRSKTPPQEDFKGKGPMVEEETIEQDQRVTCWEGKTLSHKVKDIIQARNKVAHGKGNPDIERFQKDLGHWESYFTKRLALARDSSPDKGCKSLYL